MRPPPLPMPRIPVIFRGLLLQLYGSTATPPHLGNPGSLEGFIGCRKVVYLNVAGRTSQLGRVGSCYFGPCALAESLLKRVTHQKNADIHIVPFLGGAGAETHRKKTGQTKQKIRKHFLPPSSGRHGFRFLSNVAKCSTAFCECFAFQGEFSGFFIENNRNHETFKTCDFPSLGVLNSTNPTRNHTITA